jgi:hypothetical protein
MSQYPCHSKIKSIDEQIASTSLLGASFSLILLNLCHASALILNLSESLKLLLYDPIGRDIEVGLSGSQTATIKTFLSFILDQITIYVWLII